MFACDSPVRTWRVWFSGAAAEPSSPQGRESVRVFLKKKVQKKIFRLRRPSGGGEDPPAPPPAQG
jgi:hypothetical protein